MNKREHLCKEENAQRMHIEQAPFELQEEGKENWFHFPSVTLHDTIIHGSSWPFAKWGNDSSDLVMGFYFQVLSQDFLFQTIESKAGGGTGL